MADQSWKLTIGGIHMTVTWKPVKYLRIKVKPPAGDVCISAPMGTSRNTIIRFVRERLDWIQKHQRRMSSRPMKPELELVTGEQVPFQGRLYDLVVAFDTGRPGISLTDDGCMMMTVKPGAVIGTRHKLLDNWYRKQLAVAIPPVLEHWQSVMGVRASEWRIRKMKTRWGSCNTKVKRIWFSLELAKQHPGQLVFIVVHELAHLIEPSHNERFKAVMDRFLPDWRDRERRLKRNA